jgi:hypothetical protein
LAATGFLATAFLGATARVAKVGEVKALAEANKQTRASTDFIMVNRSF